ncbi:MAG: HAD-IIIA family hydrolase [Solirubrobacteraceae bacterium]|nr:HAD-IIIA family hydrolase [Solirubrobacteraceae bacterium]
MTAGTLEDGVGCWRQATTSAAAFRGRGALFLDRDGVIVREEHFLAREEDVALLPGAASTIAAFNRAGIPVVVTTNQSGVGRGYFAWADFELVQEEISRQLARGGASIDAAYACAYHPAGIENFAVDNHPWRKPNPGMVLAAERDLGVELSDSWVVGDRARDLAAGRAAGLAGGLHVMTGHGTDEERERSIALQGTAFAVVPGATIAHAKFLLPTLLGEPAC